MARPAFTHLFVTHVMAAGTDMDGSLPDKAPTYSLEQGGLNGHAVYPALANGGLFVPPANWAVTLVQAIYVGQSGGKDGLAGAAVIAELVPLDNAVGQAQPPMNVVIATQDAPLVTFQPIQHGIDTRMYMPPNHGIRVKITGVGEGEQVSCAVLFEKYRDGARQEMI